MKKLILGMLLPALIACGSHNSAKVVVFSSTPSSGAGDPVTLTFAASQGATLAIDNGVGDVTGKATVTVSPLVTTTYKLIAQMGGAVDVATTTVNVAPAKAAAFTVAISAESAADVAQMATITAIDGAGAPRIHYAGTVQFASDDTAAVLPAPVTFVDGTGVAQANVTFSTAGNHSLVVKDMAVPTARGATSSHVKHSKENRYLLTALPAAAAAGQAVGMTIQVVDKHGNVADDYTGTAHVSSTDATDRLPADGSFAGGERAVALVFTRAGPHSVTVTDLAGVIATATSTVVTVGPSANRHYELVLPTDVVSGTAVSATVTAKDEFGNGVPGYTGAVTFTSSDGGALLPALTFAGTEGGTANVSVTFNGLGTQTLTATTDTVTGTATVHVHGLGYTNPPAALGRVQLVYNGAASTATVVQLDLVTAVPLLSAFGAGMNLPVDSTKVTLAAIPLANDTSVFNPGAQFTQADGGPSSPDLPLAEAAVLKAGVAYTGVSSKIVPNPDGGTPDPNGFWVNQDAVGIPAGTVLYSVRVAMLPSATAGTVFDGSALGAKFRAAVRDQLGNDTVAQSDFAIGKLEVR